VSAGEAGLVAVLGRRVLVDELDLDGACIDSSWER
jgi:hypothetical protein